jgi:preprotein translocase SecE subunit
MSLKNNKLVNYFKKSYQELEKVTWLTKKQMIQSSILVITISMVIVFFIALIDYLFNKGYIYLIDNFSK